MSRDEIRVEFRDKVVKLDNLRFESSYRLRRIGGGALCLLLLLGFIPAIYPNPSAFAQKPSLSVGAKSDSSRSSSAQCDPSLLTARIGASIAPVLLPAQFTPVDSNSSDVSAGVVPHGNGGNDNGGGNGGQPGNGGGGTTTTSEAGTSTTTSTIPTTSTTTPSSSTTSASKTYLTTILLSLSPQSSIQGDKVSIVFAVGSNGQEVTQGTVTFYMGSQSLGSAEIDSSQRATFSTSELPIGVDQISATYSGYGVLLPSTSQSVSETVIAPPVNYGEISDGLLLFGGEANGHYLGDTWIFDGSEWHLLNLPHSPPPRSGAMLSYDQADGADILFGGQGSSGFLSDTWEFKGGDWTQLSPTNSPPARAYGSLAEELGGLSTSNHSTQSAHDEDSMNAHGLLLFGGESQNGILGDSWIWTGDNWVEISPAFSPTARSHAQLAYDVQGQETILFGGDSSGAGYLSDTWEFRKGSWQQLSFGASPQARAGAMFSEIPTNNQSDLASKSSATTTGIANLGGQATNPADLHGGHPFMLYGGIGASGPVSDSWLLTDSGWTELKVTPPPMLTAFAWGLDPSSNTLVAATGISSSGAEIGDTWGYNGTSWSELASGASPPSEPGKPVATASNGQVSLVWRAPTSSDGAPVSSYEIVAIPSGLSMTVQGCPAPTKALFSGLTNSTSYSFQVIAISAAGTSQASAGSDSVEPTGPPDPPTNVVASGSNGKASITFEAPANNGGSPIVSYELSASPACPTCSGLTLSGSPPPTTTTVVGLTNGTSYTFTVQATSALGTSELSTPSTPAQVSNAPGPPGPVRNVAVTSSDGKVNVTFDPPASTGGSPITSYVVSAYPAGQTPPPAPTLSGLQSQLKKPTQKTGISPTMPNRNTKVSKGILNHFGQEQPLRSSFLKGPKPSLSNLALPSRKTQSSGQVRMPFHKRGLTRGYKGAKTKSQRRFGSHLHPHISSTSWEIATIAGGLGGPGRATGIGQTPASVAIAPPGSPNQGTAYEIDVAHNLLRAISPNGQESVFAGGAPSGYGQSAIPASDEQFSSLAGVAVDGAGNVYVTDSSDLYMIAISNCLSNCPFGLSSTTQGDIYVVASPSISTFYAPGSSTPGSDSFNGPDEIAIDSYGNALVALSQENEIRLVAKTSCSGSCPYGLSSMVAGGVYDVAGTGTSGYSGDGGPATTAQLAFPLGVAIDSAGNIFVSDHSNARIRMVAETNCTSSCPLGLVSTVQGNIYTVAGTGTSGFSGDGGPALLAQMQDPAGIALDSNEDLYIADSGNWRIRMVAGAQCSTSCPLGLASTVQGSIYTVVGNGTAVYNGDGGPAIDAGLYGPASITLDQVGNLYIADSSNYRVRLVANTSCTTSCPYGLASTNVGDIYTVAGNGTASYSGDGGPAGAAQLDNPYDVASDSVGDVIISDSDSSRIRMVAANNCSSNCPYGLASTESGDIYTVAGNGVAAFAGDGGPAIYSELAIPKGIALDAHGDILIADSSNNRVRLVGAYNCSSSCPFGLSSITKGYIYTVVGGGNECFVNSSGFMSCGLLEQSQINNIAATSAVLAQPNGVTLDSAGNLYISMMADVTVMMAASNCTGTCPLGLSATTAGYVYVVAGVVSPCNTGLSCYDPASGSLATGVGFASSGIAVDPGGDLLLSVGPGVFLVANFSCYSNCPYGLASMTRGDLELIAGNVIGGAGGPFGSGVSATSTIIMALGLAVDSHGNLLIASGYLVDLVAYGPCSSGCPVGIASMVAGDLYIVAGGLTSGVPFEGFSGDGSYATQAHLYNASGVAFNPSGDILIADSSNDRVREVFPPVSPIVSSVSPTFGPTSGGSQVTVDGIGLTGTSQVDFGTNPATNFTVLSDTQIVAQAPPGAVGTVDVTVKTLGGLSPTSSADSFTYKSSAPVPAVTGILPNTGPASGGTSITISGTNLVGATSVEFGTTPASSFSVVSSSEIDAISPLSATGGVVDVTVTTAGGTSPIVSADQFDFVVAPPSVTSVSPNSGPYFGGTTVTVDGTGFSKASSVFFGPNPASSFSVVSDTQITAVSPPGSGPVDISVTNSGGASLSSPSDVFAYIGAPTISIIEDNQGTTAGGTTIVINGTNLATTTSVTFAGNVASFSIGSNTQLSVVTPPGTGTEGVLVTTPSGTATSSFIYVSPPTVSSISPDQGAQSGGQTVYIYGTGFYSVASVSFGSNVIEAGAMTPGGLFEISTISSTQLKVITPPGSGTQDVTVTNLVATSPPTPADRFTYIAPPTLIGNVPGIAFAIGGTNVTISGTGLATASSVGLVPQQGGLQVPLTSFSVVSDSEITGVLPSVAAPGFYIFVVATLGGTASGGAIIDMTSTSYVVSTNDGAGVSTEVTHLTNGTVYSVVVYAVNAHGVSPSATSPNPSKPFVTPVVSWGAPTAKLVPYGQNSPYTYTTNLTQIYSAVSRDCGFTTPLSTSGGSSYDLWVFCDTALYRPSTVDQPPILSGFITSGTAGIQDNQVVSGISPDIKEYVDPSDLPAQFLPSSQNNTSCPSNSGPKSVDWTDGLVTNPSNTEQAFAFYQIWCENSGSPDASLAAGVATVNLSSVTSPTNPAPPISFNTGTPPLVSPTDWSSTPYSPENVTRTGLVGCEGQLALPDTYGKGAFVSGSYIYLYNPGGNECTSLYLARIPVSNATNVSTMQFYAGNNIWSSNSGDATSILDIPNETFFTGNDAFDVSPVNVLINGIVTKEYALIYEPAYGNYAGEVVVRLGPNPWGPFMSNLGEYQSDSSQGIYVAGMTIPGCATGHPQLLFLFTTSCRDYIIHPEMDPSDGSEIVLSYFNPHAYFPSTGINDGFVQLAQIPVNCIIDVTSNSCSPHGYWEASSKGLVLPYGNLPSYGSLEGAPPANPIVGIAKTPDTKGYWLVGSDGGVFAFGDAGYFGSMGGQPLAKPIVGIAPTADGQGYWLVAQDGGIFAFGDAGYFGSMGGQPLAKPIVGMASTNDNLGYWLVAQDGGVFSFGDATFYGSTGSLSLSAPIVGIVVASQGEGYSLIGGDGGIFNFGTTVCSNPTTTCQPTLLTGPISIVGGTLDSGGSGGWVVASNGQVYSSIGSPTFYGPTSIPVITKDAIVGIAGG